MTSLYVHIPFCVRKCAYCDFESYAGRLDRADAYICRVLEEAEKRRAEYGAFSCLSVYLGGGTPSLLTPEQLGRLCGELFDMFPPEKGYTRLEFKVPSRGILGYRTEFLTDTKGNGIMNSVISGFEPFAGEIETRSHGVLVAFESGEAMTYGLYNAQERGQLFIGAGTPVYEGMIVGINPKNEDITVNVCKKKHVTNMRAAGSDDALRLTPPLNYSLEQCLEFVGDDELCEVTPKNIRLRKKILSTELRAKDRAAKKNS